MPPKGKCHKNSSTSATVSVSNPSSSIPPSELPEDIIVSILKRLPVKSILCFKCVCKQWLSLLSSPLFVSIHLQEILKTPLNDSFIISCDDQSYPLNVNSIVREPVSLVNLFPEIFRKMDLVGSVNGLLCLSVPPLGQTVILWNPAMNLHKAIRLPIPDENTHNSSLGLAYDSLNDDYKIIRIDSFKPKTELPKNYGLTETLSREGFFEFRAEVYSASFDSWKRVPIDFHFILVVPSSYVIVNGIPYWFAVIFQPNNQWLSPILMYYDMQNGSFKHVSPPEMCSDHPEEYVDWKGNLGMIVLSPSVEGEDFVDILVYDEMEKCCNRISRHGPIGLKIHWPRQCSKDGVILAETKEEKLILYDPVTNGIKELCIPGALRDFDEKTFTYIESLVTVKGMEQVKEQDSDNS